MALPFPVFQAYLVRMIDCLITLLDSEPDYREYHVGLQILLHPIFV